MGFNAIVRQPLTLHDGTVLPDGAHIQMATYAIGTDPERVEDPETFDGLRQYNNRKRPGESSWHRMITPVYPTSRYMLTSTNRIYYHEREQPSLWPRQDCLSRQILRRPLYENDCQQHYSQVSPSLPRWNHTETIKHEHVRCSDP